MTKQLPGPKSRYATSRDEHALLLSEVQSRCRSVTAETGIDHRPGLELHRLLDYLRVEVLQEHFRKEQALMAVREDGAPTPATSALGSRPHEWYAYTEGPLIDLANLPGVQGSDAIRARLLQLGRGARVEIIAGSDPSALWRRPASIDPDGYGFAYVEQGPTRWRVEVTRRVHDP
ncbi:MAG: hypothetical protein ABI775_12210 [Pseudonocardiales bacterium]